MTEFRITAVTFDERERPAVVTAVATRDAYQLITSILGTDTAASGSCTNRVTIKLRLEELVKVRQDCEKFRRVPTERTQGAENIYLSLNRVYRGLVEA